MTKADRGGERVNTGIAFVRFKVQIYCYFLFAPARNTQPLAWPSHIYEAQALVSQCTLPCTFPSRRSIGFVADVFPYALQGRQRGGACGGGAAPQDDGHALHRVPPLHRPPGGLRMTAGAGGIPCVAWMSGTCTATGPHLWACVPCRNGITAILHACSSLTMRTFCPPAAGRDAAAAQPAGGRPGTVPRPCRHAAAGAAALRHAHWRPAAVPARGKISEFSFYLDRLCNACARQCPHD